MIRKYFLVAAATTGLLVSTAACTSTGGQKQTGGALIGAAAGGLLGSQFGGGTGRVAATALGVALGGLLGSEVGQSLDRADEAALRRNTYTSLSGPLNEPIVWNNPNNGNQVVVRSTRDGYSGGTYCREFQQEIIVQGRREQAFGTACQQPDGSWKIVS